LKPFPLLQFGAAMLANILQKYNYFLATGDKIPPKNKATRILNRSHSGRERNLRYARNDDQGFQTGSHQMCRERNFCRDWRAQKLLDTRNKIQYI